MRFSTDSQTRIRRAPKKLAATTPVRIRIAKASNAPNPTSGYFVIVPRNRVHELDMTVDEALKYIISMGVVAPRPHTNVPAGTVTPALDSRN